MNDLLLHFSLERQLYEAKKLLPAERFKEALKDFLLERLAEKNESWFLEFSQVVELDPLLEERQRIWENVKTRVAGDRGKPNWRNLSRLVSRPLFWKISGSLGLVFLGIFFGARYLLGSEYAIASDTAITFTSGVPPTVQEAGGKKTNGPKLSSGDTVFTREGVAEITFFDGTFLHIDQDSVLTLEKLIPDPSFPERGRVELSLKRGRAFIRTFTAPNAAAEILITSGNTLIRPSEAAFDVTAGSGRTIVRVWERSLQISDLSAQESSIFIAGTKITYPLRGDRKIESIADTENWDKEIRRYDQEYRQTQMGGILDFYRKNTGVLPNSPLYFIKRWTESGVTPEQDRTEFLEIIQKRFREALLVAPEDPSRAQQTLSEGVKMLTELLQSSPEAEPFALQTFADLKKDVLRFPDNSPYRAIRMAVLAAEVEVFQDSPVSLARHILEYLWNIQQIILSEQALVPRQQLEEYTAVKELLPNVITADPEEKRELLRIKMQELRLLNFLSSRVLVDRIIRKNEAKVIEETLAIIEGKTDVKSLLWNPSDFTAEDNPVQLFFQKLATYPTSEDQRAQLPRLLSQIDDTPRNLPFLQEIRIELEPESRTVITEKMVRILEAEERKTIL